MENLKKDKDFFDSDDFTKFCSNYQKKEEEYIKFVKMDSILYVFLIFLWNASYNKQTFVFGTISLCEIAKPVIDYLPIILIIAIVFFLIQTKTTTKVLLNKQFLTLSFLLLGLVYLILRNTPLFWLIIFYPWIISEGIKREFTEEYIKSFVEDFFSKYNQMDFIDDKEVHSATLKKMIFQNKGNMVFITYRSSSFLTIEINDNNNVQEETTFIIKKVKSKPKFKIKDVETINNVFSKEKIDEIKDIMNLTNIKSFNLERKNGITTVKIAFYEDIYKGRLKSQDNFSVEQKKKIIFYYSNVFKLIDLL